MKINKTQFMQLIVILLVAFIIINAHHQNKIIVQEEVISQESKIENTNYSNEIGGLIYTMEIPRINYSTYIYYGHDYLDYHDFILDEDYSLPGDGGEVVIAGHKENVSNVISQVQKNDKIIIKNSEEFYEYTVEDIQIVDQDNAEILNERAEEVIIYTCYPFGIMSNNSKRYIIKATKVK